MITVASRYGGVSLADGTAILDFEVKRVELRFRKLADRLLNFVDQPELLSIGASSLARFIDEVGIDPMNSDAPSSQGLENEFIEWMMLDYIDPEFGAPVVSMFLESVDEDLADWEYRSLEQWVESAPSLYEIVDTISDDKLILRDVVTDRSFTVIAPDMSVDALRWSLFMARLLLVDDVYTVGSTAAALPRRMLSYVWRIMGHVYRSMKARGFDGTWNDFLKLSTLNLMRLVRVFAEAWAGDGEDEDQDSVDDADDKLIRSVIPVLDADKARSVLLGMDAVSAAGDDCFIWSKHPKDDDLAGVATIGRSDLAFAHVKDDCVRIYSTGRGALTSLAHTLRRGLGEAAGARRRSGRAAKSEVDWALEQIDVALEKLSLEHYSTWPDQPMGVLQGESPRSAISMETGRKLVDELLKDVEYHEAMKRRAGLPWIDVNAMWREALGVEHYPDDEIVVWKPDKAGDVEALLERYMRMDGYSTEQIFASAKMWNDYVTKAQPRVVHARTWAAAVEYASAIAQEEPVTQAAVAEKYEVSVSTLGQRYRQIVKCLNG